MGIFMGVAGEALESFFKERFLIRNSISYTFFICCVIMYVIVRFLIL